jgi:PilZ domain
MHAVKNRRSLTPDIGVPAAGGAHPVRRGGPRHEVTERVRVVGKNLKTREGWALNVSRGGVRAILEESVELGEEYEITVGAEGTAALTRHGRVVWVQEEPDGVVVGFEFLFTTGANPIVSGTSEAPVPSADALAEGPKSDSKPDPERDPEQS